MADIQSNIDIRIDTSSALASIKLLQSQISAFNNSMARSSASASSAIRNSQQNLINNLNASGKFAATMTTVKSETESFTNALQKNKMSMGEYFRYAGGASKTFGRLFTSEFNTIQKVAESRVKSLQSQYISMGRDASGALNAIKVRPLALDMNNLSTQTQIAAQKQQILNQVLKQGSTNLLNWGKNTQWAGRQLMVGFTVPLLMFANAAEKAYKDMETASVQLRRVYGDLNTTEAETNRMAKSVQNLAMEYTKYGIAVSDTMAVAAQIAATGKKGQDLLTQTNEVSRMAALGGVTQAQALETVISLTNAFGVASADLSDNINFLNYTQNQTVLSLSDMTEAIPKAAPVVQQLGGDVKDLAFFLTAMKEGGINATQGANALKSGLASIINPTKSATDFLSKFNINLNGIVQNNKGDIKQTVIDLGEALNKLDPLNRAQAIEKLFGKFQFSRMSALLKNVTDAKSQAAMVTNIAEKSKTELEILAQRELKRVSDSPLYKFQKAQKELQAALIPLGEQFMKSMAPIIDFFTKFIKGFNDLNKSSGGFLSNLVTWVGGIAPVVLMGVGLFANGIANIIKLFAGIKSFINRTQTSSSTLGETTHYMTQEQINAAAAASSLEHAHSKLTQAFTVERENLGLLIGEYELAIAAQNRLVGSSASAAARAVIPAAMPVAINPTTAGAAAISKVNSTLGGMRRGLPGYATGGHIQGPGTETSDSIPAMLSKGEYVIKASSVKKIGVKNLDALNATGNIIRRATGGMIPGYNGGGRVSIEASHASGMTSQELPSLIGEMAALDKEFGSMVVTLYEVAQAADGVMTSTKRQVTMSELASKKSVYAGGAAFGGTTMGETGTRNNAYNLLGIKGFATTLDEASAQGKLAEKALADHAAGIRKISATYIPEMEKLAATGREASVLLSDASTADAQRIAYTRAISKEMLAQGLVAKNGVKASEARAEAERILVAEDQKLVGVTENQVRTAQLRYSMAALKHGGTGEFSSTEDLSGKAQFAARDVARGLAAAEKQSDIVDSESGKRRQRIRPTNPGLGRPFAFRGKYAKKVGESFTDAGLEMPQTATSVGMAGATQVKAASKQAVQKTLGGAVEGAVEAANAAGQMASPSKRASAAVGKNIVEGAIQPLEQAKTRAAEAGKMVGNSFVRAVESAPKSPLSPRQRVQAAFPAVGPMVVNTSNAKPYVAPVPTNTQAALANAKANLAREGAWLKEEWNAIITPMKTTLAGAKGQLVSDSVFIEANVKKAFRAVVPESSVMGQAFTQLKSIMTVARGNFLTEWGWIKEEFLGGTKAMKAGTMDIEQSMARAGKAFNVTNRIAQFQLAMGDFGAILTKSAQAAVQAGLAQQIVVQQRTVWDNFISKLRAVGSAVTSAGNKALSVGKGAVSGAKSGILTAANSVGLRGNIEAQLAAQMALAKAQKATIMQTIQQTRLMSVEDKQLVALISAEQKLTEARIIELKAMLNAPTLLQKIGNSLAELGTRGLAGANAAYAAYSGMWDRFGQTRLGQMNAPYLASLEDLKVKTANVTMAQQQLAQAESIVDVNARKAAVAAATTNLSAAQGARAESKQMLQAQKIQNPKWVGGASMAMMMAPMMASMIPGSGGKALEKAAPALMIGSMLLPAIAPMLNGFRRVASGLTPLLGRFGIFGKANMEASKSIIASNAARKAELKDLKLGTAAKKASTASETAEAGANTGAVVAEDSETAANAGAVISEGAEDAANVAATVTEGAEAGANIASATTEGVETGANIAAAASTFTVAGAMALLSAPVFIVTAALLLLAAGIVALVWWMGQAAEEHKKQIARGRKEANAKFMNTDKLNSLSEITKTVSATELMDKKRQDSYAVAAGLTKSTDIGGQILKSDFGKSMLANVKTMQSSGMTSEEIGKNLGMQLATAVAQGVLTDEQARSFAAALGSDLGDMSVTTSISGSLDSLIGANGEDLLKDPLTVAVRLIAANAAELQDAFDVVIGANGELTDAGTGANATENISAAVTTTYNTLQGVQGSIDSAAADYDRRIAAEKDPTKKAALESSRTDAINKATDDAVAVQTDALTKANVLANKGGSAYTSSYNSQIAALKKANPGMSGSINTANEAIGKLDAGSEFRTNLETGLASGAIKGKTVSIVTDLNKKYAGIGNNFNRSLSQNTATDLDTAIQTTKAFGGEASVRTLLSQTSGPGGKGKAAAINKFMSDREALGFTDKKVSIGIALDNNALVAFNKKLNGIKTGLKGIKGKNVTASVVTKYLNDTSEESRFAKANWNKVFGNKKVNADVAIKFSMGGEEAYNAWAAVEKAAGRDSSLSAYGTSLDTTTTEGSVTGDTTGTTPSTNGSGGTDPKQLLKDTQDAAKSSAFAAKIASKGWGTELTDALSSADKKTQDFYTDVKNGKVILNAHGIALKKAFDKKAIDDAKVAVAQFSEGLKTKQKDAQAQIGLMNSLIAAGVDSTKAATIAADSDNLAAYQNAIKGKMTTAEKAKLYKEMIVSNQTLIDLAQKAKSIEEQNVDAAQKAVNLKQAEIDRVSAENKLPELQAKMGVYGDALNVLSSSERDINKLYDERSAALDKIQKSQEAIAAAQKDQLSVADALTKGDIAAAARAAQDARANAGQRAMDAQKNNLQNARQAELEGLSVSVNGKMMTRKEIEEANAEIQKQIYLIQLNTIDPLTSQLAIMQEQLTIATAIKSVADINATSPTPTPTPTPTVVRRRIGGGGTKAVMGIMATGGMVPKYLAGGGSIFPAIGTDTIPAMLTPGEFVVSKYAVDNFGSDNLHSINSGTYSGESVYNYNLSVNVSGANLNADDVARTVMTQIKQINSQQLRGNNF